MRQQSEPFTDEDRAKWPYGEPPPLPSEIATQSYQTMTPQMQAKQDELHRRFGGREGMVEKVARAICSEMQYDWDNPAVSQFRGTYLRMAKAAIEAMREPTEEQIDAGVAARMKLYEKMEAEGVDTRTLLVSKHPAGTIYAAMIEAALKEPA